MNDFDPEAGRILVMEDDAGIARLLRKRLEREGFAVDVAADGEEGLRLAGEQRYDAVVVDYHMPVHDGLEVVRLLRERPFPPPAVMLTGSGNEEIAVEVMKLGAGDYIVKDVEGRFLDLLPAVIRSAVEKHLLAEEKRRSDDAVRRSEERFRAIANYIHDWESWIGADGETLWINPAVERMTGYSVREAMRMIDYPLPIVHPDDRERIADIVKDAAAGTAGRDVQFRILRRDGGVEWASLSWEPVRNDEGANLGWRSSVRNITDRKRAEAALESLRGQLRNDDVAFAGIVGRHPRMRELFDTVREVAQTDVPVFIHGESGTGKELVARAIHNLGRRADKPFVPVSCGALPESLLESELFGHVKGAFTGAVKARRGRFETADGGTIFLDEAGELTPPVQVKLLRVLQERMIDRVGDEASTRVDVRVVSATHRDLREMIAAGKFREDLFYRLCVIPIEVPSLRERREDIPLLAMHILDGIRSQIPGRSPQFSEAAIDALMAHRWPGNVRELQNAIHFAAVKCRGGEIAPSHLPPTVTAAAPAPATVAVGESLPAKRGRKPVLDAESVDRALRETNGNKVEAARVLGVGRATLYRFLDERRKA